MCNYDGFWKSINMTQKDERQKLDLKKEDVCNYREAEEKNQ